MNLLWYYFYLTKYIYFIKVRIGFILWKGKRENGYLDTAKEDNGRRPSPYGTSFPGRRHQRWARRPSAAIENLGHSIWNFKNVQLKISRTSNSKIWNFLRENANFLAGKSKTFNWVIQTFKSGGFTSDWLEGSPVRGDQARSFFISISFPFPHPCWHFRMVPASFVYYQGKRYNVNKV